jgi:hypothetical protein
MSHLEVLLLFLRIFLIVQAIRKSPKKRKRIPRK